MMSDWKVELVEDNISEFHVEFHGPKDSEFARDVPRLHMRAAGKDLDKGDRQDSLEC